MEMVGLGRPQSCSGAQGSLQQLAKRKFRDLLEGLWGVGSIDGSVAPHQDVGDGLQQGAGACDPVWTDSLFSLRAISVTVAVATAALAFLAFWDYRLVLELVRAPPLFFSLSFFVASAVATPCEIGKWPAKLTAPACLPGIVAMARLSGDNELDVPQSR